MMYSGAYLAGFNRPDAALRMFRQASRMSPSNPEPYIMLPYLKDATRFEDQLWGIPGAIENVWTRDFTTTQQSGRDVGKDIARKLEAAGKKEQAAELSRAIQEANRRDLRVVALERRRRPRPADRRAGRRGLLLRTAVFHRRGDLPARRLRQGGEERF